MTLYTIVVQMNGFFPSLLVFQLFASWGRSCHLFWSVWPTSSSYWQLIGYTANVPLQGLADVSPVA